MVFSFKRRGSVFRTANGGRHMETYPPGVQDHIADEDDDDDDDDDELYVVYMYYIYIYHSWKPSITLEHLLIFYGKFIFSWWIFKVQGCHVIVFLVATLFWDSILKLYFWNFLATVIKKLLFFCVFLLMPRLSSKKWIRRTSFEAQEDAWLWWGQQERRSDGPCFVSRWHEDLLVPCFEFVFLSLGVCVV